MKKTILVVEDEKPLSEAIVSKLQKNNFFTFSATSVSAAMDTLSKESIDAIWLDHYLFGKENGLDFVAIIKQNSNFKKIPIFLVSNTATVDKVSSYMALGVDKYFTKSNYKLEQIVSDMTEYLKNNCLTKTSLN